MSLDKQNLTRQHKNRANLETVNCNNFLSVPLFSKLARLVLILICLQIPFLPAQSQASMERADTAFWEQIKAVSDGFTEYADKNGAFPAFNQFGGQMLPVVMKALDGNLTNPYFKERQDLVRQIRLEERMMQDVDFRYMMDKTLDDERIDYYRENPPADWKGIPGTIVGVGNSKGDLIAFFGIGADGKPLADTTDHEPQVRFAVVHLNQK